jgi:hypothetical protein
VRPGRAALTPRRLIETATIVAARVLGLDDRIGSLTPASGRHRADQEGPVRRLDRRDACAHVLLQTSPRDIDTVIVDGQIRMRNGVLAGFDADKAAAMIRASRERILS